MVGLIERRGGTTSLVRLGSLAKFSPIIAALYVIPALNLAGSSGSGFFSKVGLIQASVDRGAWIDWMLVATGIICSL